MVFSTLKSIFQAYISGPSISPADLSAAQNRVEQMITSNKVVVFSKSYCPYCMTAKSTLGKYVEGEKLVTLELDHDPSGPAIQAYLAQKANAGKVTVPQIFIDGKGIGGNSDLQSMKGRGELEGLLK